MAKSVDRWKIKPGDIIQTERGPFVVQSGNGRKFWGAYHQHLQKMLKTPDDTSAMRFYILTLKQDKYEVVGKIASSVVDEMKAMHDLLDKEISDTHSKNMDALDLKWNKGAVVKSGNRYFKGAYDVVTQKGEHVSAGDQVMVHFSMARRTMERLVVSFAAELIHGKQKRKLDQCLLRLFCIWSRRKKLDRNTKIVRSQP